MSNLPRFLDKDANVRAARETAFRYMHQIKLRNPELNGEMPHLPPRTLSETLEQELRPGGSFELPDQPEDFSKPAAPEPAKEYDPEREKKENADLDAQEAREAKRQEFNHILIAMAALANPNKPALDEQELVDIRALLATSPEFITQKMLPEACEDEVVTRENYFQKHEEITREMNAMRYPGLKDHGAAEFTRDDHRYTKHILRYAHDTASVVQLALNNFLTAVREVNDNLAGKGRER